MTERKQRIQRITQNYKTTPEHMLRENIQNIRKRAIGKINTGTDGLLQKRQRIRQEIDELLQTPPELKHSRIKKVEMQHQAAKQKEKVRIIQGKLQKHSYKEQTHHKNKNCNTPIIHKNDKEKKNRTNKKRQKLRTPRTQKTKNQHPARSTAAANILQRPRGRTLEE